jgi:hypothetical protein
MSHDLVGRMIYQINAATGHSYTSDKLNYLNTKVLCYNG